MLRGQYFLFFLQIDLTVELEKLFNKKPRDAMKKRAPRTFKLKRAQMNHLQTLREISEQQQKEKEAAEQKANEPLAGTSTKNP